MSVFKSKVYSSSLIDMAVDAFGFNDAHDAIVEGKPWGNMLTVKRGQNAGAYDIHNFNGETVFIAA